MVLIAGPMFVFLLVIADFGHSGLTAQRSDDARSPVMDREETAERHLGHPEA